MRPALRGHFFTRVALFFTGVDLFMTCADQIFTGVDGIFTRADLVFTSCRCGSGEEEGSNHGDTEDTEVGGEEKGGR